jgi:GNAT superfamily N-acetyltransferase
VDEPQVEFTIVDAGSELARWALSQYFAELDERFARGFDAGDGVEEAARLFNEPEGRFVLARLGSKSVGAGGVQFLDAATVEIKRMWVAPASRGLGVGKRLLARLEEEARAAGRWRVVLDTNSVLTEAISMYRAAGYRPIASYNENPYAELWFEKRL